MASFDLQVIYQDNHLLAVNKPAGLPTMGAAAGSTSLATLAKQYIKHHFHKPGNVYLGIMSRLDAATSGVVLLARTSKAAARLTEQFRTREVEKTYWAIVSGAIQPAEGELVDWVVKDEARHCMAIVSPDHPAARQARLRYRTLRTVSGGLLLEIDLLTGRKHQVRLQLAARGFPVLGDRKYGPGGPFAEGIALHARRLVCEHPIRKERLELIAPLPPAWRTAGMSD